MQMQSFKCTSENIINVHQFHIMRNESLYAPRLMKLDTLVVPKLSNNGFSRQKNSSLEVFIRLFENQLRFYERCFCYETELF